MLRSRESEGAHFCEDGRLPGWHDADGKAKGGMWDYTGWSLLKLLAKVAKELHVELCLLPSRAVRRAAKEHPLDLQADAITEARFYSTAFAGRKQQCTLQTCSRQAVQSSGAREPGWDRPCGWEAGVVLSGWWTRATRLAQSPFRRASVAVRRLTPPRTLPAGLIAHAEQWGAWIAMCVPTRTQQSFWRLRCIHERPVLAWDLGSRMLAVIRIAMGSRSQQHL